MGDNEARHFEFGTQSDHGEN